MRYLKVLALLGFCFLVTPYADAQRVVIGFGAGPGYYGPPPVCTYGYYGYYPYDCAPYGYYGPSWFYGGAFIGAGPWYRRDYGRREYYEGPGYYGRYGDHDRGRGYDERWGDRRGEYGRRRDGDGYRGEYGYRGDENHRGGDYRGGGEHRGDRGGWRGGGENRGGGGNSHGGRHR